MHSQEMTKSKNSTPRSDYRRTSTGNATTRKVTKGMVSFIEKLAEKDSNQTKKKDTKNLATDGLIDKDKVKAANTSSSKKNKNKKGSSSSSSS